MTSLNKVAGIALLVATIGVTSCQALFSEPTGTARSLDGPPSRSPHGTPVDQR